MKPYGQKLKIRNQKVFYVVAHAYRDPNTDITKFTKYLSSCLLKSKSEDKLVFIMETSTSTEL